MKTIYTGIVTKYSKNEGFGFISNENLEEIYFHTQSCSNYNIGVGSPVTYIKGLSRTQNVKTEAFNLTRAFISNDGQFVVNRPYNHIHKGVESKLEEVIQRISCNGRPFFTQQIDFNCVIGQSKCVEVNENDPIIYAIRDGRKGHTKFVKDKQPEQTNSITVVMKKTQDFYTILTAFFGKSAEVEPWDERADINSQNFWKNHALIFGSEPIDVTSITEKCPWEERIIV